MTIVIDCFKLVKGTGKSIGIYNVAKNLTKALAGMEAFRGRIVVLGNRKNRADFECEGVWFREISAPFENKLFCILWELFLVPFAAGRYHPDKVIYPRGFAPMICFSRSVVIVHDLIPFYYHRHFRGYLNRIENFYIMRRLKASVKKAESVVTISQASKDDIVTTIKCDAKKVHVIYNGCDRVEDLAKVKEPKPYILAVSSPLPHKNAAGIVRAYEEYRRIAEQPLPLVLSGVKKEWMEERIPDFANRHITCCGYFSSDQEFYTLIAGARMFLFLSLAEGFGLPPVEAMRLGVPVICSDRSCLPEIVGDAALLVEPENPKAVGQAIKQLCEDSALRDTLRERGYARSAFFSWERAKEAYGELLRHS